MDINCDRCRDQKAMLQCTDCDLPFCPSCFSDVHSKGKYKMHVAQQFSFTQTDNSYQTDEFVGLPTIEKSQSISQFSSAGRARPPLLKGTSRDALPSKAAFRPPPAPVNSPGTAKKPTSGGFSYI